jgi:type I restriction enzyme S subunit
MKKIPLNDSSVFALVGGLWKGERDPLMPAFVLRSTNFRGDGLLDFSDVAQLSVEARHVEERRLAHGDTIIERSGGGPKQPVGRAAFFDSPDDGDYFPSNFTTALRVVDRSRFDPRFVALFLHALYLAGETERLQRATTGIRNLDWQEYLRFEVPELSLPHQTAVAEVISGVRSAYQTEDVLLATLSDLKRAAMRVLFTRGLTGEAQKETEIGVVPESWVVVPLGSLGRVGNGSTPKKSVREYWEGGTFPWLTSAKVYDRDIKAADQFVTATALRECHLPQIETGAILIAITGQGKTLGHCAVLRMPATVNQHVAYVATDLERADPSFVRGYLETQYDYFRQVGAGGGSTKGALTCAFLRTVPIPLPPLDEQKEIVAVLDAIDRKIDLHRRKRAVLDELFKALLHKLMTGEIDVADVDLSALVRESTAEAAA